MRRYSLRAAALDGCFIPIGGFTSTRWYYRALLWCWRADKGDDPIVVWDNVADEEVARLRA